MKILAPSILATILSGCSYYQTALETWHTETRAYICTESTLRITKNALQQKISFTLNNKDILLKKSISATGERYTNGIYVLWEHGNSTDIYYHDNIILHSCHINEKI